MINLYLPIFAKISITIALLGFVTGALGVFIVLKKQALVGDAIAHSSLPGVMLAYLIFNQRRLEILIIGAMIFAIISMALFNFIKKYSKIKNDAILAIILSGMFGLGIALYEIVKIIPGSGKAGLVSYIYGQTATILNKDMYMLIGINIFVLLVVILLWKEFKLSIFNEEFGQTLGFSNRLINSLLGFITVIVVVSGIEMVGVVLISALLIAPAVSARQWSDRLSVNVILAGFIGAGSGALGAYMGNELSIPPGPAIIIVLSIVVVFSLFFAPKKGIVSKNIRNNIYKRKVKKYGTLINIYNGNSVSTERQTKRVKNNRSYNYKDLARLGYTGKDQAQEEIYILLEEDLITIENNSYHITEQGLNKVRSLLKEGR